MSTVNAMMKSALASDQARIERIANNLANIQTPGYKQEIFTGGQGTSFASFLEEAASAESQKSPSVKLSEFAIDKRNGTLKMTGRALDVALSGQGYFEVATENGPAYTRRGDFQVDEHGRLVTAHGLSVVGQTGEINLISDRPEIDANGQILDSGRLVSQFHLIDADGAGLQYIGEGLYLASGPVRELSSGEVNVRQGFLENSNVDNGAEMTSLVSTVRHFEAILRAVQARDDLAATAIHKFGEL